MACKMDQGKGDFRLDSTPYKQNTAGERATPRSRVYAAVPRTPNEVSTR